MHWKYWIKNHSHGKARYMGTPRLWERKIGSYYSKGRMMTGALCRSPLLALCTRRSGVAVRTYAPSKHIKILNSHIFDTKVCLNHVLCDCFDFSNLWTKHEQICFVISLLWYFFKVSTIYFVVCQNAHCTHSYICLKGIPESSDALTKLHFREWKFAEK